MPFFAALICKITEADLRFREILLAALEKVERHAERLENQGIREDLQVLNKTVENLSRNLNVLSENLSGPSRKVKAPAEAQRRTKECLNPFGKQTEENLRRVWQVVHELAEAREKTEEIKKLSEDQGRFAREQQRRGSELGWLAPFLKNRHGIAVQEKLVRTLAGGDFDRIRRNGEEWWLSSSPIWLILPVRKRPERPFLW
ncbi:hypothetical protein [Thermosulfurimonas sp. F29]|uniref:hypothetical protein n=1 Tax=Thermosulfurimonas sp. F29 TaxID=2867247 RepID=UPI001C834E3B|nr:hypothetical protein [Thermosulfurimonas sp. F29]MBX6423870.1 hypothetical protein [Thermosulfurimonas sp. F29]